jgi:hypothetical protein
VRKAQKDIFQTLKENICQPRFMYTAKLSFIIEGEIKPSMIKAKGIHNTEQGKHN